MQSHSHHTPEYTAPRPDGHRHDFVYKSTASDIIKWLEAVCDYLLGFTGRPDAAALCTVLLEIRGLVVDESPDGRTMNSIGASLLSVMAVAIKYFHNVCGAMESHQCYAAVQEYIDFMESVLPPHFNDDLRSCKRYFASGSPDGSCVRCVGGVGASGGELVGCGLFSMSHRPTPQRNSFPHEAPGSSIWSVPEYWTLPYSKCPPSPGHPASAYQSAAWDHYVGWPPSPGSASSSAPSITPATPPESPNMYSYASRSASASLSSSSARFGPQASPSLREQSLRRSITRSPSTGPSNEITASGYNVDSRDPPRSSSRASVSSTSSTSSMSSLDKFFWDAASTPPPPSPRQLHYRRGSEPTIPNSHPSPNYNYALPSICEQSSAPEQTSAQGDYNGPWPEQFSGRARALPSSRHRSLWG